jgi:acyl-CoA reductase-like NAD-dependent aldehyde dehydrogenase
MSCDPAKLAEAVSQAILAATTEDPDWDALDDSERADFLLAAHNAIGAHDKWLTEAGFRIVPPGMTPVPASEEEANAMLQAVQSWRQARDRKNTLVCGPKLIMPGVH